MEYLHKVAQISPNDPRIAEVQIENTKSQARWSNKLGLDSFRQAIDVYQIWCNDDTAEAIRESFKYFIEAMNCFLSASNYAPDDLTILENIEVCTKRAS